ASRAKRGLDRPVIAFQRLRRALLAAPHRFELAFEELALVARLGSASREEGEEVRHAHRLALDPDCRRGGWQRAGRGIGLLVIGQWRDADLEPGALRQVAHAIR